MSINVVNLDPESDITDFDDYTTQLRCQTLARYYASINGNTASVDELFNALYLSEKYNNQRYLTTDQLIEYGDEIESIEELDAEAMMYDISVAGDQLYYANGILTKNSAGLPATADFMLAISETEQLAQEGLQLAKQIKSRYGDKNRRLRFPIKVYKGNQMWGEAEIDQAGSIMAEAGIPTKMTGVQNASITNVSKSEIEALAADIKFD